MAAHEIVVVYRNEWPIAVGTIKECAERLETSENCISSWASPARHKRYKDAGYKGTIVERTGVYVQD